ncbi:MAG TPA: beta-ketoacyl synthase N-terminal-like domain-containing protein [Egibacteraceae bacterium]|nr:beta-ketoacyl synthase N-terminal-like domain-containing protein [Egibacteraceae bacterium]
MSVLIAGAGQTAFGDHPSLGVKELFAGAVADLAGTFGSAWDPERIDVAYIGSLSCGQGLQLGNFAPALLDYAALPPVPSLHVESACASGGFALQQAIHAVASGQYRCALAAGVEKMRDVSADRGRYWLGISGDTEYERLAGLTFAGIFALMASRLLAEGAISREDLAHVAVKNHGHAVHNPKAHLRRAVTLEQVLRAPFVAEPLGVLDCCPTSDGAACVLVCDAQTAAELSDRPVEVIGWGASSDSLALHSRPDITRLEGARRAADAAYRMAGCGPEDLDVAELHDCFTVAELMAYPELGLSSLAEAGKRIAGGEFSVGGRLPVNTSGGLKAKGHPIGATGIGQIAEVFQQIRGEADSADRQVQDARIGMAYNMGGSGASATVAILKAA